jgi:(2Fe-2S) ferredoxin
VTGSTPDLAASGERCAIAAAARGDSGVGTAAPARRWLLLEHPGPWAFAAVAGSGIDADVLHQVQRAAGLAGARILLIRRPGRRQPAQARRWAVVSYDGATVWGSWAEDRDLLEAVPVLKAPPPDGTAEPILLVCAHGLHDPCCAIRGRPVAAALHAEWPDWTWECSHVGGDRFAPNIVVLPDGAYYGGLEAADAVATVGTHLDGAVLARHLRGFSTMTPPAQAAAVAAHARYGPADARQIRAGTVQPVGDHHFSVDLLGCGGMPPRLRAVVRADTRPPALLTCRASTQTMAVDYVVETLDEDVS